MWQPRVKCSRPYDLMARCRVQYSSSSFARSSLAEERMIKEKIQPWSCRRNQANWSLEENDRRRCLLGSMDDMYIQRANSSGCFPLLHSNKKHLSSCISFEFIMMTSLVSHVSILINWCDWTSQAQEPSELKKRKEEDDEDDERHRQRDKITSFVLMRCLEALLCYSYLSKKQRCWELRLTLCVCARTQMIVIREREKNRRCRQQWSCDDDNDDGEAQAKGRMGLTLSPRIYLLSSFFSPVLALPSLIALLLDIPCLFFFFSDSFFSCLPSERR